MGIDLPFDTHRVKPSAIPIDEWNRKHGADSTSGRVVLTALAEAAIRRCLDSFVESWPLAGSGSKGVKVDTFRADTTASFGSY